MIEVGDLVRISQRTTVWGRWKRKNNLWTVLEAEGKREYIEATATIHNGHKLLTLPQKLLEKV
tara:strand:- start:3245 stop:3433 length:189 start_codon:yes stop_codon:yes gene_type:complete